MWDAVRIDGKIFTVPATYKEYVTNGFVWREDLRKKYNLPTPVDIATFEQYLDGIKKNEPSIQPLAIGSDFRNSLYYPFMDVSRKMVGALQYGMYANYDTPGQITSYWGSPERAEDLKRFKSWADNGYIS